MCAFHSGVAELAGSILRARICEMGLFLSHLKSIFELSQTKPDATKQTLFLEYKCVKIKAGATVRRFRVLARIRTSLL